VGDDRPLDDLVAGLRPASRGHFLEAQIGGKKAWIIALDEPLSGAALLRKRVQEILEGALVAAVSAPAPQVRGDDAKSYGEPPTGGVHLFLYREVPGDLARAVLPFGLAPSALSGPRWDEIRTTLAASFAGMERPVATFTAQVAVEAALGPAHAALVADTLEPWGASPGQPAERLVHLAEDLGVHGVDAGLRNGVDADLAGLDAIEKLFVSRRANVLRWIPPLVLQAMADFIGVIAQGMGSKVEWAECMPEPDGYTPPPLFRLTTAHAAAPIHLPIALHLVQWCVMPVLPGETLPPLSAWLADQVGPLEPR